ncbi:hypothetical protein GJAV_G00275360 [Gymnothorax javanicus]|nr:hypothetical protein GJAV_G00275360 [Gymnothorax javanicus]
MLFTNAKNIHPDSLCITTANGSSIERVSEYKYLGIWIDHKFNFKFHIGNLVTKLHQKVGFLYRNKSHFRMSCRKRIVEATFLSVLDYGDVIYRHAAVTTLKPLDSVYHSALRFVTGASYNSHHCLLYDMVGWSSLEMWRNRHWLLFILKALLGKLLPNISMLLTQYENPYPTRSNDWLMLEVPCARTELGKTAFQFSAPYSWNLLQSTLKLVSLPSFNQFKAKIRDLLVSSCVCFD